jgi:hypothetical protein
MSITRADAGGEGAFHCGTNAESHLGFRRAK